MASPLSDRELWACANMVVEQHGGQTFVFVAERIGALALAGDEAGIAIWKAIAARIEQMGLLPMTFQ